MKLFYKAGPGKFIKKIPLVGALIDFGINYFIFKEPLKKALFKAVGAGIGTMVGGFLAGKLATIVTTGFLAPVLGHLLLLLVLLLVVLLVNCWWFLGVWLVILGGYYII